MVLISDPRGRVAKKLFKDSSVQPRRERNRRHAVGHAPVSVSSPQPPPTRTPDPDQGRGS